MNIDDSKAKFDSLVPEWHVRRNEIETEQDTRFNMIDVLLTEVLGWSRNEISTEPRVDSGYVDYLLKTERKKRFVVEAKRAGRLLIDTKSNSVAAYVANGPALKSADEGLEQVQRYCAATGVQFSALTPARYEKYIKGQVGGISTELITIDLLPNLGPGRA